MNGLSLEELLASTTYTEPPRIGTDWDGKLEEWLAAVILKEPREDVDIDDDPYVPPDHVQHWSFPTDALRDQYLESISERGDEEVTDLLRLFLFENGCFGTDSSILDQILNRRNIKLGDLPSEYERRLLRWMVGKKTYPNPGVRWCLDLIPDDPQRAVDVISAYTAAHIGILPDGRIDGLTDAMDMIQARWLQSSDSDRESLYRLSPRDLECLGAALYEGLGYEVTLTPPSRDGGRDVVASKIDPGQRDHVLIECKAHTAPVGVEITRSLLGVVANERATRGVLITVGRFTRGAKKLAADDPRIELVDGDTLARLLKRKFGRHWRQRMDYSLWKFQRTER